MLKGLITIYYSQLLATLPSYLSQDFTSQFLVRFSAWPSSLAEYSIRLAMYLVDLEDDWSV